MSDTADAGQGPSTTDGGAPAAPAPEAAPPVQPTQTGGEAQPDSGQGFIDPYLEDVDPSIRDTVAQKLEAFRRDSDANVTRRFQQVNDQLEAYRRYGTPEQIEYASALHQELIERPVETVQWLVEQFQQHASRDLRKELLDAFNAAQAEAPPGEQAGQSEALTRSDVEQMLREQQQAEQQRQAAQEAAERVNGWIDEEAKAAKLNLSANDVGLRQAIMTHAKTLLPAANGNGQQAIRMAVEAIRNALTSAPATDTEPPPQPKLADGGSAPLGSGRKSDVDFSDPKQRREAMLSMLGGAAST